MALEIRGQRPRRRADDAPAPLADRRLRRDRPTVEALLAGRQSWPHTVGMQKFEGTNLPLSLFEENGLVAFYAGWCTIHCQPVRDLEKADPSLLPLIRAIQLLTDICYGQNGYIQPHYTCPKNKLEELFAPHFGNRSVLELLPELRLQECHFMLPPGNQNFSSLVSTSSRPTRLNC